MTQSIGIYNANIATSVELFGKHFGACSNGSYEDDGAVITTLSYVLILVRGVITSVIVHRCINS